MKKHILLLAAVLCLSGVAFAQEIQEDELFTSRDTEVEFISYEGTHDVVDTQQAIFGIGATLSSKTPLAEQFETDYAEKYRVLHIIDNTGGNGLNADIFILEESSRVDHIRNVRLILTGYLINQYGYSQADAGLLSKFITVYNAVHRGQIEYLGTIYNSKVLENINIGNAGIDVHYKNWPGKTRMLIPLTNELARGDLSSLDTTQLTDDAVTEELQQEDDMAIEERKEMVDLKEREVEQDLEQIAEQKEQVQQDRQQVEEKQEEVRQQLEETTQQKTETQETLAELEKQPEQNQEKIEELEKQVEELEQKEDVLQQEETQLAAQEEQVQQQEEEIAAKEEQVEQKQEEIREDREEIAQDQAEVLAAETVTEEVQQVITTTPVTIVKSTGETIVSTVSLYNADSNEPMVNSISIDIIGRNVTEFAGSFLVLVPNGDGTAKMTLIDSSTLEIKVIAQEVVAEVALLSIRGSRVYTIIQEDGSWYLAQFDQNLERVARSSTAVYEYTAMNFHNNYVFVQDSSKTIVKLELSSLGAE